MKTTEADQVWRDLWRLDATWRDYWRGIRAGLDAKYADQRRPDIHHFSSAKPPACTCGNCSVCRDRERNRRRRQAKARSETP